MRLQPRLSDSFFSMPWVGRIDVFPDSTASDTTVTLAKLRHRMSSQLVVLRRLDSEPRPSSEAKTDLRPIHALRKLRHQNVQGLLGTCSQHNPQEIFLVSEHVGCVPVLTFLGQNPSSDRRRLVSEVARGLAFLHGQDIVHGSLCSDNIHIASDGRAVLVHFQVRHESSRQPLTLEDLEDRDWMQADEYEDDPEPVISFVELQQTDDPRFDYRYYPEIRHVVDDGAIEPALADAARASLRSHNAAGDLFAFGFAVVEIFTGIKACSTPSALRLVRMVWKAAWPAHPGRIAELRGLDDALWRLCLRLWNYPGLGPINVDLLVAAMDERRNDIVVCPVKWRLTELESWVNAHVHQFTGVRKFERVPPSRDVDENIITIRIIVKHDKRRIPAKLISHEFLRRVRTKLKTDLYGEVVVWSQLRHPNVLPLLGLCFYRIAPAFIVPWMDGGSCIDWLGQHPDVPRLAIAEQVAAGLNYMHTRTPAIVHGDVRAHTVVFTADGTARLSNFDFGPQQDPVEGFDQSLSLMDAPLRNAAPDFVNSRTAERTTWSDVYSFSMFMFELYAGHAPFIEIVNYQELLRTVKAGSIPARPAHPQLNDDVWALMLLCWRRRPMSRPTMRQVQQRLAELASGQSLRPLSPPH